MGHLQICLAYAFVILMLVGALVTAYMSLKVAARRQSGGDFTGEIGSLRIRLSAGSLAAFGLGLSTIWVIGAVLARPALLLTPEQATQISNTASVLTKSRVASSAEIALVNAMAGGQDSGGIRVFADLPNDSPVRQARIAARVAAATEDSAVAAQHAAELAEEAAVERGELR
jgi:hypothetical protein